VTPEQITADQAAVDAASAEMAVAQQNLAQASITAPIAGTVAAIGLNVGSSAGSNGITIIGPGAHEVNTTVTLTNINLLKVGDSATVAVDGLTTPLTGKVSSIGMLNTSSGSSTTYPITVALDPTSSTLYDGAGAAVTIAVASVANVLTVPSSAVHSLGNFKTVTVLSAGKTSVARVVVGAVGVDRTQITSGLKAGQQVVLAQLNLPLPTTGSTTSLRGTGLTGTGGGFGGSGTGGGTRGGTTTTRSGG
jgi:multidrug efflux pump subunit AcrA (membrane-fusion protein)